MHDTTEDTCNEFIRNCNSDNCDLVLLCILYFRLDKPMQRELCIDLIIVKNKDPSMCMLTVSNE